MSFRQALIPLKWNTGKSCVSYILYTMKFIVMEVDLVLTTGLCQSVCFKTQPKQLFWQANRVAAICVNVIA